MYKPKPYEMPEYFCPQCNADLCKQKGFSPDLFHWVGKSCGTVLTNPEEDDSDSDIVWFCDGCGACLNEQEGFDEDCGEWTCSECGYVNAIDPSEVYYSNDEFEAEQYNPYRGLTDAEILELSLFRDEESINGRGDIILTINGETGKPFVKKFLTTYDKSIYKFIKDHPIGHMPRIIGLYESSNCLIVLESYIEGPTLADILAEKTMTEQEAVHIAKQLCMILCDLHGQHTPIIHRDIKPSNIIVNSRGEVFLLDMNVAKWYDPDQSEDTRYMGTQNYAAPEQVGYGLSASSAKTDIYAVGMLMNVMLTGAFPKEKKAEGRLWRIIERCISLDAENRYSARELLTELQSIA